ncbi:hypothetical protein F5I97DRAFT_334355 [Phlebopus sp. FC_14]|nr:hypothetical protein F5I97DRAFT_334355 [Phlebopus sp. FC_14]
MSAGPPLVSTLLILSTVLHALAVILTSFRLWFRYRIRRLWWDDFWAALALSCDIGCAIAMWTLTVPNGSRHSYIVSYWLGMLLYTCLIWFARLSIIISVVRVVPPSRCIHLVTFGTATALLLMWAFILSAKTIECAIDRSWYNSPFIACPIPPWVALGEVITDVASDVMLVLLPLRLLWRVKLPSNQRIMILCVFSSSILTSVVSVVHTAYIIPDSTFIGGMTAEIEGAVSLIVCNLLVIVTFLYRVTRGGRDLTDDLISAAKKTRSSRCLTTIELSAFGSRRTECTTEGTDLTSSEFIGTDVAGTGHSGPAHSSTVVTLTTDIGSSSSSPSANPSSR